MSTKTPLSRTNATRSYGQHPNALSGRTAALAEAPGTNNELG
jgi:hypothetical protein